MLLSMSRRVSPLAGFQVTIIGRFWVTTEGTWTKITTSRDTSRPKGNSCVWDSVREQVTLERGQLHRLFPVYRPLLEKCAVTPPNDIELYAFAAILHSFYNGIENIFKRVTLELGDAMPGGESWHKDLLDSMTRPPGDRNSVLSPELARRLKEYMEFRHVFRHAYTFNLRWDRLKTLVLGCEEALQLVESELDRFFEPRTGGQ